MSSEASPITSVDGAIKVDSDVLVNKGSHSAADGEPGFVHKEAVEILMPAAAEPEEEPEGEQVPDSPAFSLSSSTNWQSATKCNEIVEEWSCQWPETPSNSASLTVGVTDILPTADLHDSSAGISHSPMALSPCSLIDEPTPLIPPLLRSAVPPPPAPCYPVCSPGVVVHADIDVVDTTPCLVEMAASAASSSREVDLLDLAEVEPSAEGGVPTGEECERLLPGFLLIGTCRSASSRSSPGAGGSSRCDIGDEAAATPRDSPAPALTQLLSGCSPPMSSCAPSPLTIPTAPASSPVRIPVLSTHASHSHSIHEGSCEQRLSTVPESNPVISAEAPDENSHDASAWLKAFRRTLMPTAAPDLGRFSSLEIFDTSESSSGAFGWCCSLQTAPPAETAETGWSPLAVPVDVAAAVSIPASEARLLSVPRPSLRGLRAISCDAILTHIEKPDDGCSSASSLDTTAAESGLVHCEMAVVAESCGSKHAAVAEPFRELTPPEVMQNASCSVLLSVEHSSNEVFKQKVGFPPAASTSLPPLPRQAPALPSRAPSGDNAADAVELLLSRVVDPFGEDIS